MFNNYFSCQCTLIRNGSKLSKFSYKTENKLTPFGLKDDDILPIIKTLNLDKAHGWDQLSIRMIRTCVDSIIFPMKLIFKSVINEGVLPEDWKKSNVVPVYKKESKNLIKKYRRTSLLPLFSKVFEKLVFTRCLTSFCKISYPTPVSLAL